MPAATSSSSSNNNNTGKKKKSSETTGKKTKGGKKERASSSSNASSKSTTKAGEHSSSSSSFVLSELQTKIVRLETELAKEAAYRNHAQLERDKINAFWEISKRALERSESIAREYERRIDDVEDEADVRVRAKVQQIKHEQKENEGKVDLSRAESTEAIREAKSTFEKRVEEMREKIREEERKIAEREVKCQEMVRKSEIERMKEITKLRVEFEEKREKEREVAARRERMHFEKAEQTLAETVERLTKSKEKQLDILGKESEEHMKKTELYY